MFQETNIDIMIYEIIHSMQAKESIEFLGGCVSVKTQYMVRGGSADNGSKTTRRYSPFHELNKRHENSEKSPRKHHAGEKVQ